MRRHLDIVLAAMLAAVAGQSAAGDIFPAPREAAVAGGSFVVDERVVIAVPASPSEQDLFLARSLADDLADRFGVYLKVQRLTKLEAARRAIVMGNRDNPLVMAACARARLQVSAQSPGPEGYLLRSDEAQVLVAGSDDRGAFYGLQSIRQLVERQQGHVRLPGVSIRDWPDKPFRGIKLYLPGRNNIPFFKRFVRDFMALYKYNTLILEMNASMRLERHPELNAGWQEFARDTNYSRHNYPLGSLHGEERNSTHQDTADGGFLEKEEVADLARWVRRHHIELIPELPSFTHSYYLLSGHRELSEVPGQKWPDVYCPSNPKTYELLFDVYDEYIEVLKPRMIHAGHDELFMPVGLCPLCKGKDIGERFGEDVRKIHGYLAKKGIRLAIWGDMLLEEVRGKGLQKKETDDGWAYQCAGGMTREQVERLIPKDILLFNWFWHRGEWPQDQVELFEARLEDMGFSQVYGNFSPGVDRYEIRKQRRSLLGGAPSAWFATGEAGFGKDVLPDFLGCSNVLWRGEALSRRELGKALQARLPGIRASFRGELPPSRTESSIQPLAIASRFNLGADEPSLGVNLRGLKSGSVMSGPVPFELATASGKIAVAVGTEGTAKPAMPGNADGIQVGLDATSLIFLHACAQRGRNGATFQLLWDPEDTADLLGWYEVTYEDGFVVTIPIRYGVNIAEWKGPPRYCYGADPVALGQEGGEEITFFAYEWTNPRLGKVIKEIRLKGTTGFRGGADGYTNDFGPGLSQNGVILKAVSLVRKRG